MNINSTVSKSNRKYRQEPADTTKPVQSPLNQDVVPIREDLKARFGIDTFFATETIPYQGNFQNRGGEAEAFSTTGSLQERLGDRYRLFWWKIWTQACHYYSSQPQ